MKKINREKNSINIPLRVFFNFLFTLILSFLLFFFFLNGLYKMSVYFYDLKDDKALFSVNICWGRYLLNVNRETLKEIRNLMIFTIIGVISYTGLCVFVDI